MLKSKATSEHHNNNEKQLKHSLTSFSSIIYMLQRLFPPVKKKNYFLNATIEIYDGTVNEFTQNEV